MKERIPLLFTREELAGRSRRLSLHQWSVMTQSWQCEAGYLACRWSEVGQREKYNPRWMQECDEAPSGHLPATPDFVSHSPFGGVAWFQPNPADSE